MKILVGLTLCCYPENRGSNQNIEERTQQYVNGISRFFSIFKYKENTHHDIHILITDNTIRETLPVEITRIIPEDCIHSLCYNNKYGRYNKGGGLIEQWKFNESIIENYDWYIHFEPRQQLLSNVFIDEFLKQIQNQFTINKNVHHFNTGLFCIESKILIKYINSVNIDLFIKHNTCIEDSLYVFFKKHNICYRESEKMDLIWLNHHNSHKLYHM